MADRAASRRQEARHARRHRAVHDLGEGEHDRRARARPAGRALAGVGVPRARRSSRTSSASSSSSSSSPRRSSSSASSSCTTSSCPRALDFLTSYDDELYDIQIRASYYYTFAAMTLLAGGLAFLMPIFVLGLVRLRVLTSDRLRRNRRIAYVAPARVRDPAADGRPVSLAFEIDPAAPPLRDVDLALRLHGAPLGPRLGRGLRRSRALVRVLSADWVVPVEGPPIRDGAVAIDDDGRIAAVGTREELGERRALRRRP